MAVLSKIRQRSLLLILVIGFCLFAFIVGDLINSGGFTQTAKDVGSINGKEISFDEFRIKVSNVEKSGQGMSGSQAANQVWEQEVNIALLSAEFEKLGIHVGQEHIMNVFKQDPNIGQNPMFQNAGVFDINKFKEYFKSNPQQAEILKDSEKQAALNSKFQIYSALVKSAIYTTDFEGKVKYEMEANKATFDFVAVPYTSINDKDVKVTDEDIIAHMKKNEKKYKYEETREIEYVVIEDKASPEDEAEVKTTINALLSNRVVYNQATGKNDTLPGFREAKNNAEFVNENSDVAYDSSYIAKSDLPAQFAEQLFNLQQGEVFGPYLNGKNYSISKLTGRKPGAKAKASHVLISWEGTKVPNKKEKRTKEQAKAKADDLLAQAQKNPSNFFMLALMNSDDSSAQQGGDLGFFSKGQMVKPFNDFVFNNPVGKIGLVESEFGYHIINVTDKQDAVQLATIAQKIEPSEATSDKIYNTAVKFEMDATDKDFEKVAKASKLTMNPAVKVKVMDENFGSIGAQRQIVRWAFEKDVNVGDVKRFEVANVGNVIAKLKTVYEAGLTPVAEARPMLEGIIKNKKKAELIKAKMNGTSLEAIAKANKVMVQKAVDVTIDAANLATVGFEPKAVGTAMATAPNKMSGLIEGTSAIIVVKTSKVTKAPALKEHKTYVERVKSNNASAQGRIIPALKQDADIEDNRAEFNY